MFTATTFFIVGFVFVGVLIALSAFSGYYYIRAKEIAPFILERERLLKDIDQAQTTLSELQQENALLLEARKIAEDIIADSKQGKKWLEENEPKINNMKLMIEETQRRLKDATDAMEKRQAELNELTQQVADKNVELNKSTTLKNELDINAERLRSELSSMESQKKALTEEILQLKREVEDLTEIRNKLDAEAKDLQKRVERLQEQLKSNEQQYSETKNALTKANEELAEVEGKANVGRKLLAELNKQQESNVDRWRDLDAPYVNFVPGQKTQNIDEIKWLNSFIDNLSGSDFRFNERSIKAFHTGLKCADVSSLVILAGISGTGKSLLPELYATALGMNFLPMAVQPRWDSPQDLFGFYNYMEGRYKATELARLLWQFDRYNNSNANSIKLMPMNLVLLDEMNLARVEYYFSDLLSKLEIRSGINPNDEKQRRPAEVEIESAAILKGESRRRLFVDRNTLFVGTMNEDESTQSLSDKVLDRANVLRFGRPEKLDAKPDKQKFKAAYSSIGSICESNWLTWKKNPNKKFIDDMRELLRDVNPALDEIGRPYAYRVAQAMEAFVGFYPGNEQKDFNSAVSDQIEMKILPKLNGDELDMPGFDRVKHVLQDVIGQLEDEKLNDAFRRSCDQSGNTAFFKWQGVMR